jgi:hypothetical protein
MAKDPNKIIADQAKQIAELRKQVSSADKASKAADTKRADVASKLTGEQQKSLEIENAISKSIGKSFQLKQKQLEIEREMADLQKVMQKSSDGLSDTEKKILDLSKSTAREMLKQLKIDKQAIKIAKQDFDITKKALETQKDINTLTQKKLAAEEKHLKLIEKRQKFAEKYSKTYEESLGYLDDINDKIKEIPVVGTLLSDAFGLDNLKEKLTESFKDGFTSAGKSAEVPLADMSDAASAVAGEVGGIGPALSSATGPAAGLSAALGPVALIAGAIGLIVMAVKEFVDIAMEADEHTTNIANNMNITKDQAHELHHEMSGQKVLFEQQVKYSKQLRDNFGEFGSVLAAEIMPRMKQLQHNLQLSDDELSNIVQASQLVGISFEGTADKASEFETAVINTTKEYYQQQGIQLTNAMLVSETRENLQAISGINKKNLALYGKSGDALIKQVMNVRKLGLSFDQIAKTMDSVLDIESSIENEMKANVLLGKSMNLDGVRRAALFGDAEDAAKELNKVFDEQNINLESFNEMLPLQKKVLAESLGMSEEDLQNTLLKKKLGNDKLLQQIKEGKLSKEELAKQSALTQEEAQKLILSERRTNIEQDMQEVQMQFTESIKGNMKGIQSLIEVLSDFGRRAAETDLLTAMMGGGTSKEAFAASSAISNAETMKTTGAIDAAKEAEAKRHEEEDIHGGGYARKVAAGAAGGAILGSMIPIVGTAIGGVVGAMGGYIEASLDDAEEERLSKANQSKIAGASMNDGVADSSGMLLSGPAGSISLNANDTVVAGTDLFSNNGGSSEVAGLLKELIAKVSQPTVIKFGSKTIEEFETQVNMRKSYTSQIDRGYGATS